MSSYWRSEHPEVQAYWEECARRNDAFKEGRDAFLARFEADDLIITRIGAKKWGAGIVRETSPGEDWVPWRRFPKGWRPNTKRKTGKALRSELMDIEYNPIAVPGFPSMTWPDDSLKVYYPGFERIGEVIYAGTGASAQDIETDKAFNPDLWTSIKTSEYHLAKEAQEEAPPCP